MIDIIRIHEPGELIALVPMILGFVPRDSIVVLGVDARSRVSMTARLDRADCRVDEVAVALADATASEALRTGSTAVVVVEYADEPVPWGTEASELLVRAWDGSVEVRDVWVVHGGRYWAPGCDDRACCPPGGRAVPPVGEFGKAARRRVRDHTAAGALPIAAGDDRRRARRARSRFVARRERSETAWREEALGEWRAAMREGGSSVPRLGRLGASIAVPEVRDSVILAMLGASGAEIDSVLAGVDGPPGGSLERLMHGDLAPEDRAVEGCARLLVQVAAVCRPGERAHALGVLSLLRWWQGDPEGSACAAEAALVSDTGLRLAALVKETVVRGIVPGWLRSSRDLSDW